MNKPRILIVEDEVVVAMDLRQQVLALGYEPVGETRMGEEAILLAGQLQPDLVLMDINLAGEMDGIAAAEVIRSRFSIPVVFLTASTTDSFVSRAKLVAPLGFIYKPFQERELSLVIELALSKHRTAPAGAAPLTEPKNRAPLC
ncbi:MAG: response regulator [Opitutales bacterium]|nr:response regulator [Opitutales bacterium]